jgi:hypothetical protein
MKIKIAKYLLSALLLAIPFAVMAQGGLVDPDILHSETDPVGQVAGFSDVSVGKIVATVIQAVLGLLGLIFLVLIIMAGVKWMTAGGDEKKVEEAVASLKSAVIGLVIILSAYTLTYFIFKALPFTGAQINNQKAV